MNQFKSFILAGAGIALLAAPLSANAAGNGYGTSNCTVVYGGGQVCPTELKYSIDKKVQSPNKGGEFVDNLGFNDTKFAPSNQVTFKIVVKNTGENTINQLTVTDTLPDHVTFKSGAGVSNPSNKTVTYTINDLKKGESNEQTIAVTLSEAAKLPSDQGVICLTNKARATDTNGNAAEDASGFCVQKQAGAIPTKSLPQVQSTVPPKSIPSTGPEMLPLLGLIPAGITGLILRKKSKLS